MFSGLLKPRFYSKCHSLLKMTKTRLDVLKKKKSSVVKFLKKDMADLLKNGLDHNAYCRAEGLIIEQRMLACYNFVEQFCACISDNISTISKQRECPDECKEAVQSLIFAAARIAEFPELRDLRNLLADRYGYIESYVNKEFVDALRPASATKEMKLQLMHDIAVEFSIDWNSKSLEQKLFRPPSAKDAGIAPNVDQQDGDFRDGYETENKVKLKNEKEERINAMYETYYYQPTTSSEDEVNPVHKRNSSFDSVHASSSSVGSVSEDEVDSKKPSYKFIPPPYIRQKVETQSSNVEEPLTPTADSGNEAKSKPRSVRRRKLQPPPGHATVGSDAKVLEKPFSGHEKVGTGVGEKTNIVDQRDEEEKMIDGLLLHYSNKDKKSTLQASDGDHTRKESGGRKFKSSELPLPPGREEISKKEANRHARGASCQPEALTGHVHPNLPDYDDLAAQLAALRRGR